MLPLSEGAEHHPFEDQLTMHLSGTIHANLRAAVQSARRLKEGPVHPDTLEHWSRIVAVARGDEAALLSYKTRELLGDLEREIDARKIRQKGEIRPEAGA